MRFQMNRRSSAEKADGVTDGPFNSLVRLLRPHAEVRRLGSVLAAICTDPPHLPRSSQDALYAALPEVSARVFGLDMSNYWEHRRRNNLFGQLDKLYLFGDTSGDVIGWATYCTRRYAGRLCIYFDNAGILPKWRRNGVMRKAYEKVVRWTLLRHPWERVYLITRTANPVVYRGFQMGVGASHTYPAPGHTVPPRIAAIAQAVAEWLGEADRLEVGQLKFPGCYRKYFPRLYAERPRSGDEGLDRWFDASLGPADAFLVISEASIPSMAIQDGRTLVQRLRLRSRVETQEQPVAGDHW